MKSLNLCVLLVSLIININIIQAAPKIGMCATLFFSSTDLKKIDSEFHNLELTPEIGPMESFLGPLKERLAQIQEAIDFKGNKLVINLVERAKDQLPHLWLGVNPELTGGYRIHPDSEAIFVFFPGQGLFTSNIQSRVWTMGDINTRKYKRKRTSTFKDMKNQGKLVPATAEVYEMPGQLGAVEVWEAKSLKMFANHFESYVFDLKETDAREAKELGRDPRPIIFIGSSSTATLAMYLRTHYNDKYGEGFIHDAVAENGTWPGHETIPVNKFTLRRIETEIDEASFKAEKPSPVYSPATSWFYRNHKEMADQGFDKRITFDKRVKGLFFNSELDPQLSDVERAKMKRAGRLNPSITYVEVKGVEEHRLIADKDKSVAAQALGLFYQYISDSISWKGQSSDGQ